MRNYILTAVFLILLSMLWGCGTAEQQTPQSTESADGASAKKTFMVYMVGSDLESRGGAGTQDLAEMAASGVNTDNVNVLVYAGGTPYWHNEIAKADVHTVMQLTADGFTVVHSAENASMGEAQPLSYFLNYAYTNYPADEYALVMWNHGSGPVMGYGMDILFNKDSLTLSEMQEAFEASPFQEENKLSFIGFDACLMASAELACLVGDYAHYLISSQEVEPAFGWNYSFLGSFEDADTLSLADTLTASYLASCEEYFAEKGYSDKDTTISCVDLSYAKDLSNAVTALFSKAADTVTDDYNKIVVNRTETRALGRATTGSEYDLVDLADMVKKLRPMYLNEANALLEIIDKMVVYNRTNTEGCCGMSIFYPFFNKYYYTNSWKDTYASLHAFSGYDAFLGEYSKIWLASDKVDSLGAVGTAMSGGGGTYTLALTDEQVANAAFAKYYILEQMMHDAYRVKYVSGDVELNGNILSANFDGTIIYAKNNFEEYAVPYTLEQDTVGENTRYTALVDLRKRKAGSSYEIVSETHKVLLSTNSRSNEVLIGGWIPESSELDEDKGDVLIRGKSEDVDFSEWESYHFIQARIAHITRYENGAIRPVSDWVGAGMYTAQGWHIADGLEFVRATIDEGKYALMFEITDTQGNMYCSEPLPIEVAGVQRSRYAPTPVEITYDGAVTEFYDSEKIHLGFTTVQQDGSTFFAVQYTNKTGEELSVALEEPIFDNGLNTYHSDSFSAAAGETGIIPLEDITEEAAKYGALEDLERFSFVLYIRGEHGTVEKNQKVTVRFTNASRIHTKDVAFETRTVLHSPLGLNADEQVIYADGDVTVTLMYLGKAGGYSDRIVSVLKCENHSDKYKTVQAYHSAANGITLNYFSFPAMTVAPHTFQCYENTNSASKFTDLDIFYVETFEIALEVYDSEEGFGFSSAVWVPVKLQGNGLPEYEASDSFREGQILAEQSGVRISLVGTGENYKDEPLWKLAVVNDNDFTIEIRPKDWYGISTLGPHQKSYIEVYPYTYNGEESVSVQFTIMDYLTQKEISVTDAIPLTVAQE